MPSEEMLGKYADVAIQIGVGLEEGDRLFIRSSVDAIEFTRILVERAYDAGAVNVDVLWKDDAISVARFSHGSVEASKVVSTGAAANLRAYEMGDLFLTVYAEDPNAMAGQDVSRIGEFQRVNAEYLESLANAFGSLEHQWSIVAAPTPSWAQSVFPEMEATEAQELLWESIFRACRADSDDPVAEWNRHLSMLVRRRDYLSAREYVGLRYVGPGTDLRLGLPDDAVWQGGNGHTPDGRPFAPNIPTEEVFVSPHMMKADGVVKATKPLSLFGNLVDDFSFELANGEIVGAQAGVGQAILDELLETDEGSRRFGEAAMVPMSSAVAAEGLVWNNTLYDENDGCHIAIGRSYPTTVKGGAEMNPEQRLDAGLNFSNVHVDFVVGSPDLTVFGVLADGGEEPVIESGEWAF